MEYYSVTKRDDLTDTSHNMGGPWKYYSKSPSAPSFSSTISHHLSFTQSVTLLAHSLHVSPKRSAVVFYYCTFQVPYCKIKNIFLKKNTHTMRYHLTLVRMAIIKKDKSWYKCGEKGIFVHCQ